MSVKSGFVSQTDVIMQFSICEKFSCGKSPSGYSEDRIVASDHHFGILDGSRGPSYARSDVITATLDEAVAFIEAHSRRHKP